MVPKKRTKKNNSKKLYEDIAEYLGVSVEDLPINTDPILTYEEQIYEAQAVINYFKTRGRDFIKQKCQQCGEMFAYSWHYEGIKTCSADCMKIQLQDIGLNWHLGRSLKERWGFYYPAVVPPQALQLMEKLLDSASTSNDNVETESNLP